MLGNESNQQEMLIDKNRIELNELSSKTYIESKKTKNTITKTTKSCSVSKETIDLTVTRWMLWSNNMFKSANISTYTLLDQSIPLVTVRSNVS